MSDQQQPDDQQIRETLIQLHNELERTKSLNKDEQDMLRHLMADIQDLLSSSELESDPDQPRYQPSQNFLNRLQDSIDLFEANHSTLRIMLEKALDTLSIAGI